MLLSKVDFIASNTLTFSPCKTSKSHKRTQKKSKTVTQSKPQLLYPTSTLSTCSSIEFSQVGSPLIKRRSVKHYTHSSLKPMTSFSKTPTTEVDSMNEEMRDMSEVRYNDEAIDVKIKSYLFIKKKSRECFE